MSVSYKKLLPKVMQTTRWGDLIDVVQSIWVDIKTEKIDKIIDQYDFNKMDETDVINLCQELGYPIKYFTGYTSELYYFKRQAETISLRIKSRNSRSSYWYTNYVYNLYGDVFPLISDSAFKMLPILDWWTLTSEAIINIDTLDPESPNILYYLATLSDNNSLADFGTFADTYIEISANPRNTGIVAQYLDDSLLPNLDGTTSSTRHLLLSYSFLTIENTSEFLSLETLQALYNDNRINKKQVEILYYEPKLKINIKMDQSVVTDTFKNYNETLTATQKNIYITGTRYTAYRVRFGNSAHSVIDTSITDVASYIAGSELLITIDCSMAVDTTLQFEFRRIITEKCKLWNFSELSVINNTGDCMLYSCFPMINFYKEMNANICVQVNIIP